LIDIDQAVASPYMGEVVGYRAFIFFPSLSSGTRTANAGHSIATYYISIDVVWPKDVFSEFHHHCASHGE
jgi:hypothetical protein